MTEIRHPLLDGHLQQQIQEATQEVARWLSETPHRLADIGYVSRIHPETIRLIRAGTRPSASPETLDALVRALEKLDNMTEPMG